MQLPTPPNGTFPDAPALESRWDYPIDASMNACQAVAIILDRLLRAMTDAGVGVVETRDADSLHDYRVAVRRTRSAFSLFKEVLSAPGSRKGRKLFKDLGRRTTYARDLDVLLLELPGYVEELTTAERVGAAELARRIVRELEREYAAIRRWLEGKSYHRKVLSWRADLERLAATNEGEPISQYVATAIRKAADRTDELARTFESDDPEAALHRLRIRFKKLRYALEFASPLTSGGEIDAVIALLKRLQNQLGEHQDLAVHAQVITKLYIARDADVAPSALGRRLVEFLQERRERLRASIEQQAPAFELELASELDLALVALEIR